MTGSGGISYFGLPDEPSPTWWGWPEDEEPDSPEPWEGEPDLPTAPPPADEEVPPLGEPDEQDD